jgi:hypothetical protein
MENKDLLRFADDMMTEHVQAERKEKNIHNENEFDKHADINMEAVRTRDYIRWLEDGNNRIKDKKLLINRSPIGSNDRFVGEDCGSITIENFIEHFGEKSEKAIADSFDELGGGIKFSFTAHLLLYSVNGDDYTFTNFYVRVAAPTAVIDKLTIHEAFKKQYEEVAKRSQDTPGPSDLRFWSFVSAYIHIDRYQPVAGGTFMKTPKFLADKKCVINVDNSTAEKKHGEDECFRYSTLASVKKPKTNPDRYKQYDGPDYDGLLDFTDIPFPTPCTASIFKKFEKNNQNYALNVFSFPTNGKSLSPFVQLIFQIIQIVLYYQL